MHTNKQKVIQAVWVLCTASGGGRMLNSAHENEQKADAEAAKYLDAYRADGWTLAELQTIPEADGWRVEDAKAGRPELAKVYRLAGPKDERKNLEIYKAAIL